MTARHKPSKSAGATSPDAAPAAMGPAASPPAPPDPRVQRLYEAHARAVALQAAIDEAEEDRIEARRRLARGAASIGNLLGLVAFVFFVAAMLLFPSTRGDKS